jgi:hypothetical protein
MTGTPILSSRGGDKVPNQHPSREGVSASLDWPCGGARLRPQPKEGHSGSCAVAPALKPNPGPRELKPGALIIAAHYASAIQKKTGPGTQSGGIAHPGPHAPGEGASEFVSRGDAACVQNLTILPGPQMVEAATLPLNLPQTANLPSMIATGSPTRHGNCIPTSREQLYSILQTLAMSGCVSATPKEASDPTPISSEGFSAPNMASNGSTPPWTDAQSLGGSNFKERGKLLLLSELRKRRDARLIQTDLCGND